MGRINRTTHGTTGFVATLVLTCAFAIVATVLWTPRQDNDIAAATDVPAPVTETTAAPAAAVR